MRTAVTIHRRAVTRLLLALGVLPAREAWAQAKTVEVAMQHDDNPVFEPATVQISVGDTVRWTNKGLLVHTATFDPAQAAKASNVLLPAGVSAFDSPDLNQDDTYSHTFAVKGTYKYVCKYHEDMGMVGAVIVS